MILESDKLRRIATLAHGFSTRLGGVSRGPYATLNLGTDGDGEASLAQNRRRFRLALGFGEDERLIQVKQVHGRTVLPAEDADGREADGIVLQNRGALVGVRTADCAPILIASLNDAGLPRAVAAVHAGWRGATAGIAGEAVRQLVARGGAPSKMIAAIGPTIGLDAFEVGPEVIDAAASSLEGEAPPQKVGPTGRPHLDLRQLVVMHLIRAGLEADNIDLVGDCTFENRAMYFSHRRDRGITGRQLSAIGIR